MRLRGGTAGILAALAADRLDDLCARDRHLSRLTPTALAKLARRDAHRARVREKRLAKRDPF